jgi:hypothetical protein
MNETVFQSIVAHLLGHKYYVNIVNTRGTDKLEATSFIHHSIEEAEQHRRDIESTHTFLFVETVSFRSRKVY